MPATHRTRLLIIGAGPAGYTAAIYAARAGLKPILVAGLQPGGQLTITTDVENYPGFADVIQGPWLMEQMQAQAEHLGTRVAYDLISSIDLTRRPFILTGDSGKRYSADTVIVATGAQAKWLGIPSEDISSATRRQLHALTSFARVDGPRITYPQAEGPKKSPAAARKETRVRRRRAKPKDRDKNQPSLWS